VSRRLVSHSFWPRLLSVFRAFFFFFFFFFFFSFVSGQDKTFRPKKGHSEGTKRYDLHKHAKATLGSGNLQAAVKLPDTEEKNEWL
jgi:hypothetical protein